MSIPTGVHSDWPWPLSYIPRRWTAIPGDPPVHVIYSSNFDHRNHNPDIPNKGAWALSFSKYGFSYDKVDKDGCLVAFGTFRFDYVDHYYELGRFKIGKVG